MTRYATSTNILTLRGLDIFVEIPAQGIREMKVSTSSRKVIFNERNPFVPMYLSIGFDQSNPFNVPLHDSNCFEFTPSIHYTPDYLGADFGSNMGLSLDALILVPHVSAVAVQGMNVVDYADVCIDGFPVFVNARIGSAETPSTIRVRFSVDGGYTSPTFNDYAVDSLAPSGMDAVPEDVFEGFLSTLRVHGIEITDEHTINCDLRDHLPDIIYTIASDNDTPVVSVVLTPDDYVGTPEFGFCLLMIRPSGSGEFALGPNFMKHVAVVFDYVNEQIGFCEPV